MNDLSKLFISKARGLSQKLLKSHIEFFIDEVNPYQIRGWAWAPSSSEHPVLVELIVEGRVLASTRAASFREDLHTARLRDGNCAFELKIPREQALVAAKQSLRFVSGDGRSRDVSISLFNSAQATRDVEYHLDAVTSFGVRGWAYAPGALDAPLNIEVLSDDEVISDFFADQFREDLALAGKRDGNCAFEVAWPVHLRDGNEHRVALRRRGASQPFHKFGARVFAEPTFDIEHLSPAEVIGRAFVEGAPEAVVDVRLHVNGKELGAWKTGPNASFVWRAAEESEERLRQAVRSANNDIRVELLANGRSVRVESYRAHWSSDRAMLFALEESGEAHLSGWLLLPSPKRVAGGLKLSIDGTELESAAGGEDGYFRFDLSDHNIEDGTRRVQLVRSEDTEASANSFVSWEFDYARFRCELDVLDARLIGSLNDARRPDADVPCEVLVDGRAVAMVVAKASDGHRIAVRLSKSLLDGKIHAAQLRPLGSQIALPARPILFRLGAAGVQISLRVEPRHDGRLSGFAFSRRDPTAVAEVTLALDGEIVARSRADQHHRLLGAHGMVPADRGFEFSTSAFAGRTLVVEARCDKSCVKREVYIPIEREPFTIAPGGCDENGICFVLPRLPLDVPGREAARALLFHAVAASSASKVAIALFDGADGSAITRSAMTCLIEGLVGRRACELLGDARFFLVPEPIIDNTCTAAQKDADRLDIWLRANDFEVVVASTYCGPLAYAAASKRQGLGLAGTKLVQLAGPTSAVDRLLNDQLIDDARFLFDEALEREAGRGVDVTVTKNEAESERFYEEGLASKVRSLPTAPRILEREPAALPQETSDDRLWLSFVGPQQAAHSLVTFCDAIDRLARRADAGLRNVGVVVLGPSDVVRGKSSADYVRGRAKAWPFSLRIFSDLGWDGYMRQLGELGANAVYLCNRDVEGDVWDAAARASGLRRVCVSKHHRSDNPTAMAEAFVDAITSRATSAVEPIESRTLLSLVEELPDAPIDGDVSQVRWPLVSICVSHFNRPTLLRQTLESIEACNYPAKEIVVVDDGSSLPGVVDELREIEAWLAQRNGRLLRQQNAYLGAARNTAAANSTGSYIVFMDDDNLAHPDMIRTFVSVAQRTKADIVTARFAMFDGDDVIAPAQDVPARIGVPLAPDTAVGALSNCFGDANMLISRAAFDRIGGFTEDYGRGHEDWEMMARANMLGLRHELLHRPLFWYRVSANSMLRARESINVDLVRNIRAYKDALPPGVFRLVQLAQGLLARWDRPLSETHAANKPHLHIGQSLAYGRVAVIMRTKDRAILLRRALDSVIAQTFQDWVIIVVNDGGDPRPVQELLREREAKLAGRYLLVNNPESTGMENASNIGLVHSASEFVVVHDDDDSWAPKFLERTIAYLDRSDPEVAGVVTLSTVVIEEIDGDTVREHSRHLFKKLETVSLSRLAVENDFPPISLVFRRSAIERIGHFDGSLPVLGDWDFHRRLNSVFRIDVIPEELAYYHHRVQGTGGAYGNSVVAEKDVHRIHRAQYINRRLRDALANGDVSEGEILFMGEMFKSINDRLDSAHDFMLWLEKLMKDQKLHLGYVEKMMREQK